MSRIACIFTVAALGLASPAWADEPSFLGKPIDHWMKLLKEGKTAGERRRGLLAMTLIGPGKSREVLPAVVAAMREDADAGIRRSAAMALGRMSMQARKEELDSFRHDQVRLALVGVLKADKSGAVRAAAATSLGQLGNESREAVGALSEALTDKDEDTRAAAAGSLMGVGKGARDALPDLVKALEAEGSGRLTRINAAVAIGVIGAPDAVEAVPVLRSVLGDAKAPPELRKTVAETLGRLGKEGSASVPELVGLLSSAEAGVALRRAAAGALDQMGPDAKGAVEALQKATRDKDRFIRCLALHALGGMGEALGDRRKEVVTGLLRAMNDSVLEVRLAAIQGLGRLGPDGLGEDKEAVLDRLDEASRDSRTAVQEAARQAIDKIKGKKAGAEDKEGG
jgi:HEAT repeat protein